MGDGPNEPIHLLWEGPDIQISKLDQSKITLLTCLAHVIL